MKNSSSRSRAVATTPTSQRYAKLFPAPVDISELVALPLDEPVDYVRAGFALVPIPVGQKGPNTKGWQLEQNAIRDEAAAAALKGWNIGLAHRWSGTCAIDVDDLKAATEWLARYGIDLQALLEADDAVLISSGRQNRAKLLYRLPPDVAWLPTIKPINGLELRCANRDGSTTVQDVLPPSVHPETGKPYEWAGMGFWHKLPALPSQLLALWRSLGDRGPPPRPRSNTESDVRLADGDRNVGLASLAGTMRRPGMNRAAIEAALLITNATQCDPPLPEPEVMRIARSVSRYAPAESTLPAGPWQEPQPLERDMASAEPYPVDALPPLIKAAVGEYQAYGQQPMALVASSALATVSLAVQGLANVARDTHLTGPVSLNFLVIAQSGERKTAADRAFTAPLLEWEARRADEMRDEIKQNRAALDAWTAEQDGLKAALKRAKARKSPDAENIRQMLLDNELKKPKEVVAPRLRYEDVNPQSLAYRLAQGHPSAALWSDEGAMVTGSHGMGKEGLVGFLAMLNRLWDGGNVYHDRKQAQSVYVTGRRFTVSLMMQPGVLRELAYRSGGLTRESGFLARFLIAAPASTMGTRLYRDSAGGITHLAAFGQRILRLLDTPLPLNPEGCLGPPLLRLNPEAFATWRDYHDDVERQLRPLGDFATACDFAAKSAENAARIAACFHLFEGKQGPIDGETMRRGVAVASWYLRETLRVLDLLEEPRAWADARLLDQWLAKEGDCPIRDISWRGPNPLRRKSRRDAAIGVLEDLSRARREAHEGREVLVRNPALNTPIVATSATPATGVDQPNVTVADVANVADEESGARTLRPSGKRAKY